MEDEEVVIERLSHLINTVWTLNSDKNDPLYIQFKRMETIKKEGAQDSEKESQDSMKA